MALVGGRKRNFVQLHPVIGDPAKLVGLIHCLLDFTVDTHGLEVATRPVIHRHGPRAGVDFLFAFKDNSFYAVGTQTISGCNARWAIPDNCNFGIIVIGIGHQLLHNFCNAVSASNALIRFLRYSGCTGRDEHFMTPITCDVVPDYRPGLTDGASAPTIFQFEA